MEKVIDYFVNQWQISGNPAWLKVLLLAALGLLLALLVQEIRREVREVKQLLMEERLEHPQEEE